MSLKRILSLSHITTNKNLKSILKNGFKKSVSSYNKIQWLGNGIYFWDSSDTSALYAGKHMVINKKKHSWTKTKIITVTLELENNVYIDLDYYKNANLFREFLECSGEKGIKLLKIMEEVCNSRDYTYKTNNEIGKLFSEELELFLKAIENKFNIKPLIISYSFCTGNIKNILYLLKDQKKYKQFCLKEESIVNNVKEKLFYDDI